MTIHLTHRLQGLHALLDSALAQERARPRPDDRTLAVIRKRKLAVKDRLSRAERASALP